MQGNNFFHGFLSKWKGARDWHWFLIFLATLRARLANLFQSFRKVMPLPPTEVTLCIRKAYGKKAFVKTIPLQSSCDSWCYESKILQGWLSPDWCYPVNWADKALEFVSVATYSNKESTCLSAGFGCRQFYPLLEVNYFTYRGVIWQPSRTARNILWTWKITKHPVLLIAHWYP